MKQNKILLFFVIFIICFVALLFLKRQQMSEKFNIEIKNPHQNADIKLNQHADTDLNQHKNTKRNRHIDTNSKKKPNVDYKKDTILLSCFEENKLRTFDKYEKYSTKLYFKEEGKTLGEVWITPSHVLNNLPQITLNGYFLNNLCVHPDYRRRGIARKLLNRVIEKAKRENKLHIILHVYSKKNPHLVKFYSELGFHTYSTGIDDKGMENKLMFMPL